MSIHHLADYKDYEDLLKWEEDCLTYECNFVFVGDLCGTADISSIEEGNDENWYVCVYDTFLDNPFHIYYSDNRRDMMEYVERTKKIFSDRTAAHHDTVVKATNIDAWLCGEEEVA